MRVHIRNTVSISILALLVLLAGCYEPGGPVPQEPYPAAERAWTPQEVDAAVVVEEVSIFSPAPRENAIPPGAADYVNFLRFHPREGSGDPSSADAVLVLMPGIFCGNNSFAYLGRQMVYMALMRGSRIEIWAVDRRPNCLEDLTGLNAAEAAGDASVAIDYYYNGAEVGGRVFGGFLSEEDVPYLSEFGLQLAMEDVYKVLTTMMPDVEERRRKVFVGGHSLGGPLTAFFAAWDFDGDAATLDDAGYRNCAGLVGLDGAISLGFGGLESFTEMLPEAPADSSSDGFEEYYTEILRGLRDGDVPRLLLPVLGPEAMVLIELMGMEAGQAPQEESSLLEEYPFSDSLDVMFKFLHSRSLDHYLIHVPDITDFRYTNEALLGIVLDDNFMPIKLASASMGFLRGGPVVEKDFPLPGDLEQIPGLSDLLGPFLNPFSAYIANDAGPSYCRLGTGPLYGWANFDEIGNADNPEYRDEEGEIVYTTTIEEVTDIRDLAQTLYLGPSNFLEWYFTTRLMLDFTATLFPFGPSYGINVLHADGLGELPRIEFMTGAIPFLPGGAGGERIDVEGYAHIDVLTAAADRPSRRESEVFGPLLDFMLGYTLSR